MSKPEYSLVEAQEMYNLYFEAEKKVLLNQSYTIKDRTFTKADLPEIRKGRQSWKNIIAMINQGAGIKVRRVLYRDN